jgi:hypothetical protein
MGRSIQNTLDTRNDSEQRRLFRDYAVHSTGVSCGTLKNNMTRVIVSSCQCVTPIFFTVNFLSVTHVLL